MSTHARTVILGALLVFFTLPFQAYAQNEAATFAAKNAFYLEIGGSSGIYAVNYSRIFHQKGKLKLNASGGLSMWPNEKTDSKTIWLPAIPLEVSALYGKSNNHLELGFGITSYLDKILAIDSETFELSDKVVFGAVIPVRIGYRYQKPEGGFFFRIGYTPLFNVPVRAGKSWSFNPYHAGVSFGKSF